MTDPIADMIVRLKNAGVSLKETVSIPHSKLKQEICTVLEKEGFVGPSAKKGKKVAKTLEVTLLYNGSHPRVQDVKRISKPSRRVYLKASQIRPVRNGYGALILSTPAGIRTGSQARKEKVGGEALFEIW